ncbi:extensin-like [Vigna unguiculata]|uniref:extensin-like n=1 Tax=Vigna unguiculata TaxID=3917 RepID=UPI0010162C7E|nr:extensin-like [Vigna unguiculata]
MARISVSSNFVSFLVLLAIAFSFLAQLAPVNADMEVRKLGVMPSPPPSPLHNPPRHSRPPRPPPHRHHPPPPAF